MSNLSEDAELIAASVSSCTICVVSDDKTMICPAVSAKHDTIILRDISSDTPEEEVRAIFAGEDMGTVVGIRSDVGDTWFVTMESEESAVSTLLHLRSNTFKVFFFYTLMF